MQYPVESFTDEERERLRPTSRTSTGRCSRWSTCPRRSRARCSPATRATRGRCAGCSSTSSPTTLPAAAPAGRRRGRARRRSSTSDLPRLRRRLGRPARRRPRRLRVGLQRADQDPPAPAARRLPRAVDALHRLRRADARAARRLPLLPRRGARAEYGGRWTSCSAIYSRALPAWRRGPPRSSRARADEPAARPRARDQGQGARPAARAAAGRVALAHGHLRHRPDLRAADPAPARPPAARGPRLRADDPRRGPGGDAELRGAGGAPRPRRRVGRLPASRAPRPASAGRGGSGSTRRGAGDDAGPSVRLLRSTATRTTCWRRCCSRPAALRGGDPRRRRGARRRRARASCSPTSSASEPTAATAQAGASRRCATGLRSSPTTAPSATCSATGC